MNAAALRDLARVRTHASSSDTSRERLEKGAAAHGRKLHDVRGDGRCQSHALLHAVRTQLEPPRGTEYDADTLREALINTLNDEELLNRDWVAAGENDVAPIEPLRIFLTRVAERNGWTLDEWFTKMRCPREWGDNNTLLAATLLLRVRIHVLMGELASGLHTIEVPASFGEEARTQLINFETP